MTKKDYELIAKAIKPHVTAHIGSDTRIHIVRLVTTLAATLSVENPRFDYDRFMEACGITQVIMKV